MSLPTVLKLEGPVIVFGGGRVGHRKVEYISNFTKDITVVAKDSLPMPDHVKLSITDLKPQDIPGSIPANASLVIGALSDNEMNRAIGDFCRDRGILVNVVDDPESSTILFPALSHDGKLSVSVSTSGECPFLARRIREEVDIWIPEKARWLEVLGPIREKLIGSEEKNRVLSAIYGDPDVAGRVRENDLEGAQAKAWEVYNVCCKSESDP
ncbi:MAG: bifunctional precorrin-2 dehydrogenase/sirohydrochlorin ferrochelatase [Thermoplasmata archaeon]|nr:bifunctional precorrin-2 dehydrogenase/sirohydrochlorin ferrochelatase [Thermoplasmata archaeon]